MNKDQTLDDIPQAAIYDCAQLVKANSIEGCKLNNVDVVYTLASNLKKTGDMDIGQGEIPSFFINLKKLNSLIIIVNNVQLVSTNQEKLKQLKLKRK
jgi:hypothetical protein